MRRLTWLALFLYSSLAQAQEKKKGYNRLNASYSQLYYYSDINSVRGSNITTGCNITPQNTFGHYWGLQYERTTRYGLIMGAELGHGVRRYDLVLYQDMSTFDPEAVINLQGKYYSERIVTSVNYVLPKAIIGYKVKLNKKYDITARIGVGLKMQGKGLTKTELVYFTYETDNTGEIRDEFITSNEYKFGYRYNPSSNLQWQYRYNGGFQMSTCDIYVGVSRQIDKQWLKNISLGIEANSHLKIFKTREIETISRPTRAAVVNDDLSYKRFLDRNLSIGLRLGVGLWR